MLDVVDHLLSTLSLDETGQVLAASARDVARMIDEQEGTAAGRGRLHNDLIALLEQLGSAPARSGPKLGSLRGDEARVVARLLGHPEPDGVDENDLSPTFEVQVRMRWRTGEWKPPVPLLPDTRGWPILHWLGQCSRCMRYGAMEQDGTRVATDEPQPHNGRPVMVVNGQPISYDPGHRAGYLVSPTHGNGHAA